MSLEDNEVQQHGLNASFHKHRGCPQRPPIQLSHLIHSPSDFFDSPMSALRAVEQVHLLLLLRSGSAHVALVGIRLGVHDAGGLAESRDADAMPETNLWSSC